MFKPASIPLKDLEKVPLYQDELEALRLCDAEGMTQEESGAQMGISRGTVQRLVTQARKKVAVALVEGPALVVEVDEGG